MSSDAPYVAVVGGGFLGSALAEAVGQPCIVTTRSGAWPRGECPPHVEMVALDITAVPLESTAVRAAQALVIAVAPGGTQDRRALYVDGTRRLLDALGDSAWRRVVYISSTSAYPEVDGWVDESSSRRPQSERGQVQRDAEDAVARWAVGRGVPWLSLRLGGLYGPGRALGRVYRKRRQAPLAGDGNTPTNLIHREDAVRAARAALAAPANLVGVIGVVDDDHQTRRVMYAAVATRAGEPGARWERSVSPGQPPRGKRVSNLRMKLDLGVRLKHPTRFGGSPSHE